jgi:tetratricopeptide (TPR) repeat protein
VEEEAELVELEKLRFENPSRVIRRAPGVLRRLGKARVPRLLGICASAYRALGRADQAQVILARALRHAETLGDLAAVADLLQRASYLVADSGEYERALALSERATLSHVRTTDLIGIGKTLVDQGIWLDYMGRRQRAIRAYESALEKYLPAGHERADVRRNRFSALMNLGALHLRLGELQRAREYAGAARVESDGVGASLRGKLIWLQASIAGRQGLLDEAEGFLREVVGIYRLISPIDAALASVELVRILFQRGEPREAYATAKSMTVLLQPLEGHPVAVAALTELLRYALAGRGLTLELLEQTARGLEREGRAPRKCGARPR